MDLSTINSPQDLIDQNEMTAAEKAMDLLNSGDVNPRETLEVIKDLVEKLEAFHLLVIEKKDNPNPQWFVDANTLHFVYKMLDTVEL